MLNRRQLRVKVVQSIYAYEHSGNERMDLGEKDLFTSLENIRHLLARQLSLLIEVVDFYAFRMEEAKNKFFPTEEELNPSTRFLDNKVIALLRDNLSLQRQIREFKINWAESKELIRKLYQAIKDSEILKQYLQQESHSFAADRDFLEDVYWAFFVNNEMLEEYYEDVNIHWASDIDIVSNIILRYFKSLKPGSPEASTLPELFPIDVLDGTSEDRAFIRDLFRRTIMNREPYIQLISDRAKNWDFERIAAMDTLLLRMAVTEILTFPSIPIKVTLNEYIELSKIFSTPRSRIFINGVLDKLIEQLKNENKIHKSGRGLMDK
ncbi:MAG: transcription antitermination factor NusB [Bacteroidales bacterium]|nr:transcription antitermination factor NusB [Bacteroidales bacterium]HPE86184.1 transcription antitermination factor NusB [Bacteroidales bacterium]